MRYAGNTSSGASVETGGKCASGVAGGKCGNNNASVIDHRERHTLSVVGSISV